MPDNSAFAAAAPRPATHLTGVERELVAAREAFERHDARALATAREAFRGRDHPLGHYAEYWWLTNALAQSPAAVEAASIQKFLADHAASPLADALRREWLKSLGKQDRWEPFLAELPRITLDDAEIACHHLRYRTLQDDRGADSEIRALWNAGKPLPDACYTLFEKARVRLALTADDQWMRVRKLLADSQLADARKSAAGIDKLPAHFERSTAQIGLNPASWLNREKLNPKQRASTELFLFAITRTARSDAASAAAQLARYGASLDVASREFAYAQVGLFGAMQHDAAALDWYTRAGATPLTEMQAAWKARAALRSGDWAAVKAAIGAMDGLFQQEPAWRYWLSRAHLALGNMAEGLALRDKLARESGFYALLAAEDAGKLPQPAWNGWKPAAAQLEAARANRGIQRALHLYRLDLKAEGLREWQFALRGMDDAMLLAAAEVARAAGIPDRAISAADRTLALHDYSQRYPMPHREVFGRESKASGLDENWVFGLVRQESRFMTDARSRVGAAGLMQLMPATAKWAAKRAGVADARNLNDVATNVTLGTTYLKHVLDDLGHPVLATAAYNAGPGRARRWRAPFALEGAIYAETIPFNETRDYVKKVMANTWYYAHQNGAAAPSLKAMLGTVPGLGMRDGGISSLVSAALAAPAAP
ncbi:MAG TPA: transglycosylase SLT domain-containing protein [Usitatibacteraceae bacterium]|nr:transglycosylase SLT domain-containing protein [Usitatibacteraceae bacterium]